MPISPLTNPTVDVLVNKKFEMGPFQAAFMSQARPKDMPAPAMTPDGNGFTIALPNSNVHVVCVEGLMDAAANKSSSEAKADVLPKLLSTDTPALIIGAGTAGSTPELAGSNGHVFITTDSFSHSAYGPQDPATVSHFSSPFSDTIVASTAGKELLARLDQPSLHEAAEINFLQPHNVPAEHPAIVVLPDHVSVSNVNETNYKNYEATDRAALASFDALGSGRPAATIETSLGLFAEIAKHEDEKAGRPQTPVLLLSGITDTEGQFASQVGFKNPAVQNTPSSWNMGVAAMTVLGEVDKWLGERAASAAPAAGIVG